MEQLLKKFFSERIKIKIGEKRGEARSRKEKLNSEMLRSRQSDSMRNERRVPSRVTTLGEILTFGLLFKGSGNFFTGIRSPKNENSLGYFFLKQIIHILHLHFHKARFQNGFYVEFLDIQI